MVQVVSLLMSFVAVVMSGEVGLWLAVVGSLVGVSEFSEIFGSLY